LPEIHVASVEKASPRTDLRGEMIITTTPNIEGKSIVDYLGIVTGEAIMGANIVRDLFASITDIVGGRSAEYEEELGRARKIAIDEMAQKASELGANAVVGVDIDYEVIRQGMLMVSASGTAVRVV
jgi:uncharacterized protein YbjQ (UPF0145 family)